MVTNYKHDVTNTLFLDTEVILIRIKYFINVSSQKHSFISHQNIHVKW
jgi:hypothetical protein